MVASDAWLRKLLVGTGWTILFPHLGYWPCRASISGCEAFILVCTTDGHWRRAVTVESSLTSGVRVTNLFRMAAMTLV